VLFPYGLVFFGVALVLKIPEASAVLARVPRWPTRG
jgi:hypothetical protein